MGTLSERQQLVLKCVITLNKEGLKPYAWHVFRRMNKEGHEITEKQCGYDLSVIIRTKGTGVYSMKLDNNPKIWIYQESMAEVI